MHHQVSQPDRRSTSAGTLLLSAEAPPRPAPWKPRRRAITLIEILISMGVLTIGILGVAALFPAGADLVRRADVYDRADAAAAAALNDAVTRGLVNPDRWVKQANNNNPTTYTNSFAGELQTVARSVYGGTGGNPLTNAMSATAALNSGFGFGTVVVVDPVGVGAALSPGIGYQVARGVTVVPASAPPAPNYAAAGDSVMPPAAWFPWSGSNPVRRVTLRAPANAPTDVRPIATPLANQLCYLEDDLSFDLPEVADQPARQRVLELNGVPLGRMAKREFSYFLTVAPTTAEGRDALAYGGRGNPYEVSAVVFNRRQVGGPFDSSAPFRGHEALMRGERLARARVLTQSPSGGELLIEPAGDAITDELPWKNLRPNLWVLLYGPHPSSTVFNPLLVARWYRVVTLERDTPAAGQAVVGLRGPDWPWEPSGVSDALSNDLRLAIFPEAVAVQSRTMRLGQGAAWSEEIPTPSAGTAGGRYGI